MASANEILVNAERLISDAEHLFADGRSRSASTLIVRSNRWEHLSKRSLLRVKKTRQIKNPEPRFDSTETGL
jgi:hypothetical protein